MISQVLSEEAGKLAKEMRSASADEQPVQEDGSRDRRISSDLRARFISLRQSLYVQGRYDPILARFDSYTVEQAPLDLIADRLEEIAARGSS